MEESEKTVARGNRASGGEPAAGAEGLRNFGRYKLLKELGRGAQGVVYLAEDITLRRKVALKMLAGSDVDSSSVRSRFQREAELLSKFEHPGICGVHDVGAADGVPYIAMQFVQGVTLAQILERARTGSHERDAGDGTMSDTLGLLKQTGSKGQQLHDLIKLIERTARALHVAHEAGLVHRDVKPGNIMVTAEGNPVLLDFGIARDLHAEGAALTQSGQIIGTPAYLAPEQISASRGAVDRRTDVYALGVILFECLTLRRPYDATNWDQLFHQILNSEPLSPRRINPRIPQDICTIVEVAMDRDQARRYATAEALADDLRRVRAFEPILAKSAGPSARAVKWARRNPGKATAAGAAVLFALAALGVVAYQSLARSRAVQDNLARAEERLRAGDFAAALEAAGAARERAPGSTEALELRTRIERTREDAELAARRSADFQAAEQARAEALEWRDRHAAGAARGVELQRQLLADRNAVFTAAAARSLREDFARREQELAQLEVENEQALVAYQEALQRAARREAAWGEVSDETEAALAEHFMMRWRIAARDGDAPRSSAMRAAVELHDRAKAHERELLGRGTLTVSVAPADAELYLFRFENLTELRSTPSVPRLTPVPTSGVGRSAGAWSSMLAEGAGCLVVRNVAPDSAAAEAGLRPGDLLTRIGRRPSVGALFAVDAGDNGPLANAGAPALARVRAIEGVEFQAEPEFLALGRWTGSAPLELTLEDHEAALRCAPSEVRLLSAAQVVEGGLPLQVTLEGLRAGVPFEFQLDAGQPSGLVCEPSAYPLVFASACRIAPDERVTVDPGAYLVVGRSAGFKDQRFHVVVERLGDAQARIELPEEDEAPEGFVFVPAGPFVSGGDERAFQPRLAEVLELPGFYIARKELTNGEWYEFLNDESTRAELAQARPGACMPRDERIFARQDAAGMWTWDVYRDTSADSPVLGVSWNDVMEYLEWRNSRAERDGEAWRYDLPTEAEWEKAARGVDGREFPWGERFDPLLCVNLVRSAEYLLDAPGGSAPSDESPYGVLDLAGSREEWLRDRVPDSEPPRYFKRGGRWNSYVEVVFRSASRGEASADLATSGQGVRLVLRRP